MGRQKISLMPQAEDALGLIGTLIRIRRQELGWTADSLAKRIGVSERTVLSIEKGTPSASVGNVFNAAVVVGVELFGEDRHALARKRRRGEEILGLLPTAVREVQDDDDEFDRI